jgi:ABC-type uncharacterized transport system substrate-binding protein
MKRAMVFLTAAVTLLGSAAMAADVAVVTNKNLKECRTASGRAVRAAGTVPGLPESIPLIELDGSSADDKALERLRGMRPQVVISLAPYATRMAKLAVPDSWIVYALVPFPEVEGFTRDPKMVGIQSMGSETDLFSLAAGLGKAKQLAVVHSDLVSPSVSPMMDRLREAGFNATDFSLSQAPLLTELLSRIVGHYDAVLLLPDPLTENPYALRFLVTTCFTRGILTLATDYGLVGNGVLCGTYVPPEAAGLQAAVVAGRILALGRPPMHPVVFFEGSKPSVNMAALEILHMQVPKDPSLSVQ